MAKNEKKLIINISASKDSFGAFAENCTGFGSLTESPEKIFQRIVA